MQLPLAIALTPGEPAGIGPDLAVLLAQQPLDVPVVVIADKELLQQRAQQLKLPLKIQDYSSDALQISPPGTLLVQHVPCNNTQVCGNPQVVNVPYVLQTLRFAAEGCLNGQFAALVTGPVHKAIINEANIPFQGQTEYLAGLTIAKPVMMLATSGLRVALATTHLPINKVAAAINYDLILQTLRIVHEDLRRLFAIAEPRIHVCGLNPHAGEGGYLGTEEQDYIIPAIKALQQQGMQIQGPFAADTLFTPKYLENTDAVLAMYHDQGLPVLKYKGFGQAVNITLGLPIIRTSVDHGTALDLAGTGNINLSSMQLAIQTAIQLAKNNYHVFSATT